MFFKVESVTVAPPLVLVRSLISLQCLWPLVSQILDKVVWKFELSLSKSGLSTLESTAQTENSHCWRGVLPEGDSSREKMSDPMPASCFEGSPTRGKSEYKRFD